MKTLLPVIVLAFSLNSISETHTSNAGNTQLDDLIRGEMAAVKAYDTALKKITNQNEKQKLTTIRSNHVNAVEKLKTFATKDVHEDTKTSGAWGAFASAYTGGASLIGNTMALRALTTGEEHGVKEYKEALDDKSITPELKQIIRTQFLPKQEEHIKTIKDFM